MIRKRWGCTICGHESNTSREAERHFDRMHRSDPEAVECDTWRAFFESRRMNREEVHECLGY